MNVQEFNTILDFAGGDEYLYIVSKKSAYSPYFEERVALCDKVSEECEFQDFLQVNILIHNSDYFSIRELAKKKGNSLLVRFGALSSLVGGNEGLELLVNAGIIQKMQVNRVMAKLAKEVAKKTIRSVRAGQPIVGDAVDYKRFNDYIISNNIVVSNPVDCIEKLFNKLNYKLPNRVKREGIYTVNGRVYRVDVAIKCKRLIIDVGSQSREHEIYRESDFASIGYTILRVSEDTIENDSSLKKFVSSIMRIPNHRKTGTKEQ